MNLLASLRLKPQAILTQGRAVQTAEHLFFRLKCGAWQEAEQIVASHKDENREQLLQAWSEIPNGENAALNWVQSQPRCAAAQLLLGVSLVGNAWRIRGDAYADEVDAAAWAPFLDELNKAEAPLRLAADLDKNSADACAWLMMVAGISGDGSKAALQTLFRMATARAPHHWATHYRYFMRSTEKWGGSHKEMFSFARAAARRAPKGHPIHCLIAVAYCEYALADPAKASTKLRNAQCACEVSDALYAWLDADADTLLDKLLALDSSFAGFGLNHFAVACYLSGAFPEGRDVMMALEGAIEMLPWAWIAEGKRERADLGFVHDRVLREVERA